MWIANNPIDYPTGRYNIDGTYQLVMRNAQDNTVPPGELRPSNSYSHYSVLSAL